MNFERPQNNQEIKDENIVEPIELVQKITEESLDQEEFEKIKNLKETISDPYEDFEN